MNKMADTSGLVDDLVQNAANAAKDKQPLPFRIVTEFTNIKTTGFLDLSSALLGWVNANVITGEIALKEGGLGQYIDDMAEEKAKQQPLANNMLSQEQAMMQGQQAPGIAGVKPVNAPTGTTSLPSAQPHASAG